MIQNQSQYRNTKLKLKEFEQSLVDLDRNPDRLSPRLLEAQKAGLQVWVDRLNSQIAEYETLQQGLSSLEVIALEELPIALIKAQISLGMSQKDLAEKIGTQEQQIQRYEANHYAAISFDAPDGEAPPTDDENCRGTGHRPHKSYANCDCRSI